MGQQQLSREGNQRGQSGRHLDAGHRRLPRPPLTGIWARAPYLHNGTIPDLASLLDPASRPTRWRRTGSSEADYDAVRVGLRYEIIAASPSPDTREGRQVIDTTREGMRANGHLFGATLSVDEREDLLAYLRGL